VTGTGPHRLSLAFRVRPETAADQQSLRFIIPPLLQNRLELSLPATMSTLQASGGAGALRVTRSEDQQTLVADLGRPSEVILSWGIRSNFSSQPEMRVRELYAWALRPPAASLTGILQYSLPAGEVSALAVALPPGLEIRSVELPGAASLRTGPRLKS